MTKSPAYPLRFAPCHKAFIWGGDRIAARYGRRGLPDNCGESWEISAHPDGSGTLINGSLAGEPLAGLARRFGRDLLGTASPKADIFPLLFKIIDARENLSVQVHPTHEAALRLVSETKSESWHILDAEPGAMIHAGLEPGTTPERLRAALTAGTAGTLLTGHRAIPGETLFIPGGLVHAIGAGCLIYEVQQSANTTYRLYDWDRTDAAGRRRPLHIEEALTSIDWSLSAPRIEPAGKTDDVWHTCSATPYFTLRQARLTHRATLHPEGRSFHVIFVADGACKITTGEHTEHLEAGSSCLVPACVAEYSLSPAAPRSQILLTALV